MVAVLAIAVVALVALLVWALLRTPPRPAEQLVIYEQDQGRGGLATPRWQFNLPFTDFVRVLGERLHVHLPESRYDREKLAHSAGISITTIEKLLRGETRCRRRVEPPRAIPVGRTDAKLLFIGITLTTRTHTA